MALRKFTSKNIGNNIRKIRMELQESQEEFGKAAGAYSQDTVAKWEAGQIPHALVLAVIAKRSKRRVDWILGLEEALQNEDIEDVLSNLAREVQRAKELAGKGRKKSHPRRKS